MVVQQNLKATGILTSFGKDNFGKLVGKEGEGSLIKTSSEGFKFSFKSGGKRDKDFFYLEYFRCRKHPLRGIRQRKVFLHAA
jgi:hypothetical protein